MTEKADIYKVAGLLIKKGKLLVVRNYNQKLFFSLGGKIEIVETDLDCLYREVWEEIGCRVVNATFYKKFFGLNYNGTKTVEMPTFLIEVDREPSHCNEVVELGWTGAEEEEAVPVASMLAQHILPALKTDKLIS